MKESVGEARIDMVTDIINQTIGEEIIPADINRSD